MPDIAECLRVRTQSLRNEIEWIKASRDADAADALEHLRHIRSELSACGDLLRDPGFATSDAVVHRAASEYRDCLQRLQEVLPILQSDLFTQRSQIQPEREHAEAASEWLHCSKTTLG